MRAFSIRVISSLMGASTKAWARILQERRSEVPYGAISYGPVISALRQLITRRLDPSVVLGRLRDDHSGTKRMQTFRTAATANATWFQSEIVPKISRILEDLNKSRTSQPTLRLEGETISGGPHWRVQWIDGSERLVYIVGPKWTRKRIKNLLALLQLYAVHVASVAPQNVIVVDLHRHEIIETRPHDSGDAAEARRTVRALRTWNRKNSA